MNTQQQQTSTSPSAWWFTAPRENFTATCYQQYVDHMRGSFGDKAVSGAVVVGYLEGPSKPKGSR